MAIDWADLQGIIVRGNGYPRSWHVFYSFPNDQAAKAFLRWIQPQIATAVPLPGDRRPDSLTSLGLTYQGLRAAGLEAELKKINPGFVLGDHSAPANPFPSEFIDDPELSSLGDTSPADAPTTWWNGQFATRQIHGSLHVYCMSESIAQRQLDALRTQFRLLGIKELNPNGAGNLPLAGCALADRRRVHFGYVDGVAQPDVDWVNETPVGGKVDRRHFLLGYAGPIPSSPNSTRTEAFFLNNTYLAFRWMSQDVPAFEQFLTEGAPLLREAYPTAGDLRELLAAKLIGRWRSGVSLVDAPINDVPLEPADSFMYRQADPDGHRCPFSAHIRASNPRDQELKTTVKGVPRLIRRGMAYGPLWQPGVNDHEDRGLFGMFLCASLERQFQMVMRWMNVNDFSPKFAGDIPSGQDPLFGARGLEAKRPPFRIPTTGGVIEMPLPDKAFVRSRGTAYLLLPSIGTIQRICAD